MTGNKLRLRIRIQRTMAYTKTGTRYMRVALLAAMTAAMLPLCGCIVLGASSRGGFFIWPGGLGLLVVLLVLFLLLRRR